MQGNSRTPPPQHSTACLAWAQTVVQDAASLTRGLFMSMSLHWSVRRCLCELTAYLQHPDRHDLARAAVQGKSEQRPHKLSFHVSAKGSAAEQLVEQLEQKIQAAGGR